MNCSTSTSTELRQLWISGTAFGLIAVNIFRVSGRYGFILRWERRPAARQSNRDLEPALRAVGKLQATAVRLDDLAAQRQAEPGSGAIAVRTHSARGGAIRQPPASSSAVVAAAVCAAVTTPPRVAWMSSAVRRGAHSAINARKVVQMMPRATALSVIVVFTSAPT
jgi:hypothetical protein